MGAVLVVIAVLAGLTLLLLAVPVDVSFGLEGIEAFKGQIAIRWLLGLVRFRIPLPRVGKPPREREAAPKAAGARARPKAAGRGKRVLAVLQQTRFRKRVYRLARDLVRAAQVRELRLRMRLGLGDPADTGRLWAVVGPLSAAAQGLRHAEVRIEPDFVDPVLEFQAHGRLVLVPLRFLAVAVAFALSPPSLRAWRVLVGHA